MELNDGQPTNALISHHPTSWPKKYSVGQDTRVNMWRMSLMEMVFVVVLLFLADTVLSSYLLENCFVEEEPKFSTFKNVMQLHLFRINSNISPSITISQGGWNQQIKYELPRSTEMFKWQELRVEFSRKGPLVLLNGSLLNSRDSSRDHEMKKSKRWVVSVQDANAYADCHKKWPLFELMNNNRWMWLQLPRSGNKEVVRLEPTENTTIKMRVEDTDKKLCQKGGEAQLQNNTNSTCHHLSNNTGFSNKITIADTLSEGNNQIRILVEDLKGTLYIVQCVEDCSTTPAGHLVSCGSGPSPSLHWIIIFIGNFGVVMAVVGIYLILKRILALWAAIFTHDSFIWNNSRLRARFAAGEFQDYLLLGDSGYPLKRYLLTPFANPRTRGEERLLDSLSPASDACTALVGLCSMSPGSVPRWLWPACTSTTNVRCRVPLPEVLLEAVGEDEEDPGDPPPLQEAADARLRPPPGFQTRNNIVDNFFA
ncbi:hypothetical protein Pcinc_031914 [Petrolisthes cinctipes]|uniref:DDE Tnp4 domain-containing protein n=1 Tax=Petrolisthes cinctipes TaxID=88211 RepID=A0AAE1EV76_PETCI|nr:hypothetical protein Pcinc_031914 [Petrolisthes cinctipes]